MVSTLTFRFFKIYCIIYIDILSVKLPRRRRNMEDLKPQNKISLNGRNYFVGTIKKYIYAIWNILACLPENTKLNKVNLVNHALFESLSISFYGDRGLKSFLIDNKIASIKNRFNYNPETKRKRCDYFDVDLYSLCNLMNALYVYDGEVISKKPILKAIRRKDGLLNKDIWCFLRTYYDGGLPMNSSSYFSKIKHKISEPKEQVTIYQNKTSEVGARLAF